MRDLTKLRCDVQLAAAGTLPNDGKVIEDLRRYRLRLLRSFHVAAGKPSLV
jgi:hypothetical protein